MGMFLVKKCLCWGSVNCWCISLC